MSRWRRVTCACRRPGIAKLGSGWPALPSAISAAALRACAADQLAQRLGVQGELHEGVCSDLRTGERDGARIGVWPARRLDREAGIGNRHHADGARGAYRRLSLRRARKPLAVSPVADHDPPTDVAERGWGAIAAISEWRIDPLWHCFGRRDGQVVQEDKRSAADAELRPQNCDFVHRNPLEPAAILSRRL